MIAVSGGLDSMVLLEVLHRLAARHDWRLGVAHFNHGLRGAESDDDEKFVKEQAAKRRLRCVAEGGDSGALARREGLSLEMAARRLRHAFLARTANALKVRTVALAHHADDQAELFLVRLLRGAGGEGLAGMNWSDPSPADSAVKMIRPLLGRSRAELRAFAVEQGIAWREDATNAQLGPLRNRVRHKLIPLLSLEFQPAITRSILRTMEIIGAESNFVRRAAEQWLGRSRRSDFDKLHPAVQRQAIQIQLLKMCAVPDFGLVEQLRLTPGRAVTVSEGRAIRRDRGGRLTPVKMAPPAFLGRETIVDFHGRAGVLDFAGLRIRWELCAAKESVQEKALSGAGREWFDADKIGSSIVLRHWRPGDRFQPIGMGSPVKLQDLFVNRKIPRDERHQLVVATTAAGELFWVEQFRISERFKLDKGTLRRLKWQWCARQSVVAGGTVAC